MLTISFNQKVWFLIEIGAIKGEDFKDFQRFMEIRNMLMHNIEARTLEACFQMISHKEGSNATVNRIIGFADELIPKMFKTSDVWTVEARLSLGVKIFVDHVFKRAETAIEVLGDRTLQKVDHLASKEHREMYIDVIMAPAIEQGRKVQNTAKSSYSREEVITILETVAYSTREHYRNTFKVELLKQVNTVRVRAGLDVLTELPEPPSTSTPPILDDQPNVPSGSPKGS